MQDFTFDETNLMCIYNGGNRELLIQVLTEMPPSYTGGKGAAGTDRSHPRKTSFHDEEFAKLELYPDFDE